MDREIVRQVERLTALKTALAERGIYTRLEVLPMPYLTIPVLHVSGHRVGVSVVLGKAGPDLFMWEYGNYQHAASDPAGAADRLAASTRGSSSH